MRKCKICKNEITSKDKRRKTCSMKCVRLYEKEYRKEYQIKYQKKYRREHKK
jgi:predicted nucleic acid-binding Zn ribbon protein